jgi:hexosaminidase
MPLANITADELRLAAGAELAVAKGEANAGEIELRLDANLKKEHYTLQVTDRVIIAGGDYNAVALGTASLLQVLGRDGEKLSIPRLTIEDHPFFEYCGTMFDIARQPYSLETLRKLVQVCRLYKIRYMHLHMTDEMAWVFPSTAFPELGKHNANAFGGAAPVKYKLQELKDLVAYADARGVTLVPELEVPGHSGQLVGTLPDIFAGKDKDGKVISLGMINIGNERAYEAIDTLVGEICDVFRSSPYLHTGGDEVVMVNLENCPAIMAFAAKHDLESPYHVLNPFQRRLRDIVVKHGKQMMAWDGAHHPKPLPKDIIFMPWQDGTPEAGRLVKEGYRVINAPWGVDNPYINPYQCNGALLERGEPMLIGATSILWEVAQDKAVPFARHMASLRNEPTYNPNNNPGYASFIKRLASTDRLVDRLLYGFSFDCEGLIDPTTFMRLNTSFTDRATLKLESSVPAEQVRYTLDGSEPTQQSKSFTAPLTLTETTTLKVRHFDPKTAEAGPLYTAEFRRTPFVKHAAIGAKVTATPDLQGSYVGGGLPGLVDGHLAEGDDYSSAGWSGWLHTDVEIGLDLGESQPVDRVGARFARGRLGLTLPKSVEFFASQDGKEFQSLGTVELQQAGRTRGWYELTPSGVAARYLRLKIVNGGDWTFIDEIAVNHTPLPPSLQHAAQGKTVTLATPPADSYSLPGIEGLTDGYVARSFDFSNPYWLGTEGRNVEATIDMEEAVDVKCVGLRALRYVSGGIYLPSQVDVLTSDDGKTFTQVGTIEVPVIEQPEGIARMQTKLSGVRARYIKLIAYQQIYWTFIDEIFVNPEE